MTDSFLIVPELEEMINKLTLFRKSCTTAFEDEMYFRTISDLQMMKNLRNGAS